MKREYHVTIPIGAHAFLTVVADSEEAAVERAMEEVTLEHVEDWDVMREVNRGNVCYFPSPWEIVVEEGRRCERMSDWIEWKGGECPVADEHVDVRLRNGDEMHDWHPNHIKWGRDIPKGDHVIAYRVVQS